MKQADKKILKEIQKNAQMGIEAIQTINNKIYDDGLALDLNKQALKYTEYRNRAEGILREAKETPYYESTFERGMLKAGIHMNTMLNTSTGHMAELMIQGSNRGITDMCKAINHNEDASKYSMEIAKELMDFEEQNIERMKLYL
ncbi:MAG TPA: hypothetical protein VJZ01_03325 [Lachnospiraceae bacterium]|jgi:hypothetical protein|nr:hypothetical protein [Lachnospiraceae bacterium]